MFRAVRYLIIVWCFLKGLLADMVITSTMPTVSPLIQVSKGSKEVTLFTRLSGPQISINAFLYIDTNGRYNILSNKLDVPTDIPVIKSPTSPYFSNTGQDNRFMIQSINGGMFTNNFQNKVQVFEIDEPGPIGVKTSFGKDPEDYFIVVNYQGFYIYTHKSISGTIKRKRETNTEVLELFYEGDKFYILRKGFDSVLSTNYLQIGVIVETDPDKQIVIKLGVDPTVAKWACSKSFFSVYSNYRIHIYKYVGGNFQYHLSIRLTSDVVSMDMTDTYIFVSIGNIVRQYIVESGSRLASTLQSTQTNISVSLMKQINEGVLWVYEDIEFKYFKIDDLNDCRQTLTFQCMEPDTVLSDTSSLLSITVLENLVQELVPEQEQEQEEEQEQEQEQEEDEKEDEGQNNEDNSNENQKQKHNSKQFCFQYSDSYCETFCSKQCGKCLDSHRNCTFCDQFYEQNEDGICSMPFKNQVLISLIATCNIFKVSSSRSATIMLLFDGIQLYNFHKKQYIGTFGNALQTLDFIEENAWSIIAVPEVLDFLNQPLPLPNYNAFTNPLFLENRRSSALFFQNAKRYFVFAVPFSLFTFVVMNRLFWILSKHKVSLLLRNFSFWLTLGAMLSVQNISLLNYYFLQNLQTLFALSFVVRVTNLVTLFLYGAFLTFCISFVPFAFYLYRRLSAHFLNNAKVTRTAFEFQILRSVLRPIVQGFIHIYLIDSQNVQIVFLSIISLTFCLTALSLQLVSGFTQRKSTFALNCALEFGLFLINVLLLIDINNDHLREIVDLCLNTLMYCFIALTLVIFFEGLLIFILEIHAYIDKHCFVEQPKCAKKHKTVINFNSQFVSNQQSTYMDLKFNALQTKIKDKEKGKTFVKKAKTNDPSVFQTRTHFTVSRKRIK